MERIGIDYEILKDYYENKTKGIRFYFDKDVNTTQKKGNSRNGKRVKKKILVSNKT